MSESVHKGRPRVVVIGRGTTSVTVAAGFASLGHHVTHAEMRESELVTILSNEPGLGIAVHNGVAAGRLYFLRDVSAVVSRADVVFLCDTPARAETVVWLRQRAPVSCVVANTDVSSANATTQIGALLCREDIALVSNPQDIRTGSAIQDFLVPSRIVIGSTTEAAKQRVAALYRGINAPIVHCDHSSAELISPATTGFLAIKQCFTNGLAEMCDALGADMSSVSECLRHDERIGPAHIAPASVGEKSELWSGLCALLRLSAKTGNIGDSRELDHSYHEKLTLGSAAAHDIGSQAAPKSTGRQRWHSWKPAWNSQPIARRVAVIGTGYVGLTTGACLASLGHQVVCSDVDIAKVRGLSRGEVGIMEPGLEELVRSGVASGRLTFIVGSAQSVANADVVFLCVPTPMGRGGEADLAAVEEVTREIRDVLPDGCVLATKSTVPVGTARRLSGLMRPNNVAIVSNPEFLREGSAVGDFLHPDRIVVGSANKRAAEQVAALYADVGAPTVLTDAPSAEMVKYAANSFLATKLSYVNAIAELCEQVGADITAVTEGMRMDPRIGPSFPRPGPGWGGSCLPKDTHALARTAEKCGVDFSLPRATISSNVRQHSRMASKIAVACGAGDHHSLDGVRLGILGLTFKAGTDDLRDSPALAVAELLAARGAELMAYDPALCGDEAGLEETVTLVSDAYQAAKGAAGIVVLTEWPEFRDLDWDRLGGLLETPVVVDTRDHLDPTAMDRVGIAHFTVGGQRRH